MKKIAFLLVLIFAVSSLMTGCSLIFDDSFFGCDHSDDDTTEVVPTFEELAAVNAYAELFKTHENMYLKNTYTLTESDETFVEDIVLFRGEGKIDYHMRSTNTDGNVVSQEVSRIGSSWYFRDASNMLYTILELGESYPLDYTVPDLFAEFNTVGKAYVEGDQIVQHGYFIIEEDEGYSAKRYDHTYYFDKETKLLEKIESVQYDDHHKVIESSHAEITYDVNIEEIFDVTLVDTVQGSDKRIELEIVVGYGTEEEARYSLISSTDAFVYGTFDGTTYLMYTDPEYQNQIMSLGEYTGESALTLYASAIVFEEEVRYTVTEEEWIAATEQRNYTIEQTSDSYYLLHKYTDNAMEIDDSIILFIGDRQYFLDEGEDGYVATDCTALGFEHNGMLAGAYYDEFVYDEELCAYVCDAIEEAGAKWELRFEDGVLVSMTVTLVSVVDGVESTQIIQSYYTNVGTTVIDIPEYVFSEDPEIRKTVTEEEWNLYAGEGNFTAVIYTVSNGEYYMYSFKSTGSAAEIDGQYIVFEDGKKYILEEIDGVWYASEWNEIDFSATMIPSGLSFDDFEYSESMQMYIQKEDNGSGLFYSVEFEDGVIAGIIAQESLDPADPGYMELFSINIREIGTATIDVPEYVFAE